MENNHSAGLVWHIRGLKHFDAQGNRNSGADNRVLQTSLASLHLWRQGSWYDLTFKRWPGSKFARCLSSLRVWWDTEQHREWQEDLHTAHHQCGLCVCGVCLVWDFGGTVRMEGPLFHSVGSMWLPVGQSQTNPILLSSCPHSVLLTLCNFRHTGAELTWFHWWAQ